MSAVTPTGDEYLTLHPWRHLKTGKMYQIVMISTRESDHMVLVSYRDVSSASAPIWTRPAIEFYDGRFVRIFPGFMFKDADHLSSSSSDKKGEIRS